ncbi:MAG: rod shape-determining protein RodA [Rhodospirillales bacterium]|nr:rod shape-determining protein RodA [Rhodospirillales bacterium]
MLAVSPLGRSEMTLGEKLWQVRWFFLFLLLLLASAGFAVLYSAAGGRIEPWAGRQMLRFVVGLGLLVMVAIVDTRLWLRYAYGIYGVVLALLVIVEVGGAIGMGAQRWLDLGVITLQPSELMKFALVLALARYFHWASVEAANRPLFLIPPIGLILVPVALVLRQPDLGTAIMLTAGGAAIMFLVGIRIWAFVAAGLLVIGTLPIAWQFLRDYQRARVITFLDPESDPLGRGYHIIQSKIALGSGGVFGRGYLQGTQSHLSFLPEKQTDFIFTMLAEEFGLVGGLALLGLVVVILAYGFAIALRSRSQFGRLLAMGVITTFFLYVFINVAMVMGLIPVVGVPLPLISYGGSAMLAMLFGFGLMMGVWVHRDVIISRHVMGPEV